MVGQVKQYDRTKVPVDGTSVVLSWGVRQDSPRGAQSPRLTPRSVDMQSSVGVSRRRGSYDSPGGARLTPRGVPALNLQAMGSSPAAADNSSR